MRSTLLLTLALAAAGCSHDNDLACLPQPTDRVDDDGDGFVAADDCNDADASVHPAAPELCDGVDNDCDDQIDEGLADSDEDGIADCMDSEDCDGVDNNGDGIVDEGFTDTDGDGRADCIDVEDCDGVDNDGDGTIDEDCLPDSPCLDVDPDGDGYANPGQATDECPEDNCPDVFNPDQLDSDGDGFGDACDACPTGADSELCCDYAEYVFWYSTDTRPIDEVTAAAFDRDSGTFDPPTSFAPVSGTNVTIRAYGHFDESTNGAPDEARDILWTSDDAPDSTFLTTCDDGLWTTTTVDEAFPGGVRSWGDFNNDDCLDYVAYDYQASSFGDHGDTGLGYTWLGACDGTFSQITGATYDVTFADGQWTGGLTGNSSDWNGDGNQDLVFWTVSSGGSSPTQVWMLPGDGNGSFGTAVAFTSSAIAANSPAMGDIDGDGNVDIVLGPNDDGGSGQPGRRLLALLGDGASGVLSNPEVLDPADWISGSFYGDGTVRLWDYDKDGDLDILVAVSSTNGGRRGMSYHTNDGTGVFASTPTQTLVPYFTWNYASPITPILQQ